MIVSFIPYFVAANLATDASSWSNGPEYVFAAKFQVYMNTNHYEDTINSTTRCDIHCQPQNNDTLNCQISLVSHYANYGGEQHRADIKETIYFGLKFNTIGVANLTVSRDMRPSKQLVFRRLASLFTVGVDLSDPAVTSSEGTTEMSLFGQCTNSLIKVETRDASGDADHLDGKPYDLYPIPFAGGGRRMNIVIDKTRDPRNCNSLDESYFYTLPPQSVNVKSSASKMTVSDSGDFVSWTVTESKFEIPLGDDYKIATVNENMEISLSTVKEAIQPIPAVLDPILLSMATLPREVEEIYE